MTSHRKKLNKRSLIAYAIIICGAFISHFILKMPWEQYITSILGYYQQISLAFGIVVCGLIPFRLLIVKRKGMAPETQRFRLLGPIIDLTLGPLIDASLFYSALFILYEVFQERVQVLSLDPFLILLIVAAYLLYESVKDVFGICREIFYVERTEQAITR